MGALTPALAERIGKLLPRLTSPYPEEASAVGRAIQRVLKTAGLDFGDLAEAVRVGARGEEVLASTSSRLRHGEGVVVTTPTSRPYGYELGRQSDNLGPAAAMRLLAIIGRCEADASTLTEWERSFVSSVKERVGIGLSLTTSQAGVLERITRKLNSGRRH